MRQCERERNTKVVGPVEGEIAALKNSSGELNLLVFSQSAPQRRPSGPGFQGIALVSMP